MSVLLSISGLVTRYGAIEAVRGIDLTVRSGTVLTILGSNGAGKSTTINSIMGLVRPAAGSIVFAGRPIAQLPPERIARLGIALSPEGRRVFANLSVEENLLLGAAAFVPAAMRAARCEAQYQRFPILGERRRQKAGLLSGGEQQMLAIARALIGGPQLLLLDEPSLGLAPKLVTQLFVLIGALRDEGLTVLLVEQNVVQSLAIADDACIMANGRVVAAGTAADIAASDLARSAYFAG
jgi:branched-chain amino acid transport system ATP-binding protein